MFVALISFTLFQIAYSVPVFKRTEDSISRWGDGTHQFDVQLGENFYSNLLDDFEIEHSDDNSDWMG